MNQARRLAIVDFLARVRRIAHMIAARVGAALFLIAGAMPAAAMVGGAPEAAGGPERHAVLIVSSRGSSCTGTAIARDLVLTAAHCVLPGADYKLVEFDAARQPVLKDVQTIVRHPGFSLQTFAAHRATADVALMKLGEPLPAQIAPAAISPRPAPRDAGTEFLVAGFGVTEYGDGRTGGTLRSAMLTATGRPGNLQLRLVDPTTNGASGGLGACTGDSGAPVFEIAGDRLAVLGVVSWATGPNLSDGCGGLTGVTPLALYRAWIVQTARRLGSALD
jgi:secreted trypsin-like serine protease